MLDRAGRDRVEAAVRQAEGGTAGEIVVVVARQAASYRSVPLLYGLVSALLVPWPLIAATDLAATRIFAVQLGAALVAMTLATSAPILLTPLALRRARARDAAAREFVARGMQDTRGRTGVLLYVALAERYAEVVGDQTISARVSPSEWQAVIDPLVAAMGEGRVADAIVAAVDAMGGILARHVPPGTDDPDELPNRVILI